MKVELSQPLFFGKMIFSLGFFAGLQAVEAINVDREILILVDAQTYSTSDFDLILEGVAMSFENQSFLTAVANGAYGSIASSLIFFNAGGEQTALPWMQLSSATDLQNYATAVRNLVQPNAGGNVSYASAIATGAASIANSAFTGTQSQITMIDDGTGFYKVVPGQTKKARNAALASGVDVINAVVFDAQYQVSTVEDYYEKNIVSSASNLAVLATPQGGSKSAAELSAISDALEVAITSQTIAAAPVPEPSSALLLSLGLFGLASRRRR